MCKKQIINKWMLLLSLAGAAAVFIFGEMLLVYITHFPYWLQCGLYLLFVSVVSYVVICLSEWIKSGNYILKHHNEFKPTLFKSMLIFLPAVFALGLITQFLYGLIGVSSITRPDFQGSMIICDISGSMNENDLDYDTIIAIQAYIDNVPVGEYFGISVFNHEIQRIREYSPMGTEEERDALKNYVKECIVYDGGTDIQTALLDSIKQLRELEDPDWPGLILLFSDGLSDVNYNLITKASVGELSNEKNRIPVNTIYFSNSSLHGYQMNTIAQRTGGIYYHMGTDRADVVLNNVFNYSRSIFKIETPHLLQPYWGPARNSAVRVILQSIFLSIWGVLLGVLVMVSLNNQRLFKHYLILKIIVSVFFGTAVTVVFIIPYDFSGVISRMILAASACLMYLPVYKWD